MALDLSKIQAAKVASSNGLQKSVEKFEEVDAASRQASLEVVSSGNDDVIEHEVATNGRNEDLHANNVVSFNELSNEVLTTNTNDVGDSFPNEVATNGAFVDSNEVIKSVVASDVDGIELSIDGGDLLSNTNIVDEVIIGRVDGDLVSGSCGGAFDEVSTNEIVNIDVNKVLVDKVDGVNDSLVDSFGSSLIGSVRVDDSVNGAVDSLDSGGLVNEVATNAKSTSASNGGKDFTVSVASGSAVSGSDDSSSVVEVSGLTMEDLYAEDDEDDFFNGEEFLDSRGEFEFSGRGSRDSFVASKEFLKGSVKSRVESSEKLVESESSNGGNIAEYASSRESDASSRTVLDGESDPSIVGEVKVLNHAKNASLPRSTGNPKNSNMENSSGEPDLLRGSRVARTLLDPEGLMDFMSDEEYDGEFTGDTVQEFSNSSLPMTMERELKVDEVVESFALKSDGERVLLNNFLDDETEFDDETDPSEDLDPHNDGGESLDYEDFIPESASVESFVKSSPVLVDAPVLSQESLASGELTSSFVKTNRERKVGANSEHRDVNEANGNIAAPASKNFGKKKKKKNDMRSSFPASNLSTLQVDEFGRRANLVDAQGQKVLLNDGVYAQDGESEFYNADGSQANYHGDNRLDSLEAREDVFIESKPGALVDSNGRSLSSSDSKSKDSRRVGHGKLSIEEINFIKNLSLLKAKRSLDGGVSELLRPPASVSESKLQRRERETRVNVALFGEKGVLKNGSKRFTAKDKQTLEFLALFKYAPARHIALLFGCTESTAMKRLNDLRKLGLVKSKSVYGIGLIYWVSELGMILSGYDLPHVTEQNITFSMINHQFVVNHVAGNLWSGGLNVLNEVDYPQYNRVDREGKKIIGDLIASELEIQSSFGRIKKFDKSSAYRPMILDTMDKHFKEWEANGRKGLSPEFMFGNEYMWTLFPPTFTNVSYHVPDLVVKRERNADGSPNSIAVEIELKKKSPESYERTLEAYRNDHRMFKKVIWVCKSTGPARIIERLAKQNGMWQDGRLRIVPIWTHDGRFTNKNLWEL